MRVTDYPVIKRFAKEQPRRFTRYITDFYDRLEEVNSVYGDIKHMREFGEDKKALEKARDNRDKLKIRKYMNRMRGKLSKVNKEMSAVRLSGRSGEAKRRRIDTLQIRKQQLAKAAVTRSDRAFQ